MIMKTKCVLLTHIIPNPFWDNTIFLLEMILLCTRIYSFLYLWRNQQASLCVHGVRSCILTITQVIRIIRSQKSGWSEISAWRLRLNPITRVMRPAQLRNHFFSPTVIADTRHYVQNWVDAKKPSVKDRECPKSGIISHLKKDDNKVQCVRTGVPQQHVNSDSTSEPKASSC